MIVKNVTIDIYSFIPFSSNKYSTLQRLTISFFPLYWFFLIKLFLFLIWKNIFENNSSVYYSWRFSGSSLFWFIAVTLYEIITSSLNIFLFFKICLFGAISKINSLFSLLLILLIDEPFWLLLQDFLLMVCNDFYLFPLLTFYHLVKIRNIKNSFLGISFTVIQFKIFSYFSLLKTS